MAPFTRAAERVKAEAGPSRVFNIAELLELILHNLSPRDALISQRINKTFQSTIQNSPILQRKLLFTMPQDMYHVAWHKITDVINIVPKITHYRHFNQDATPYVDVVFDSDEPSTVGWQGKTTVHTEGSWRKMRVGGPRKTHVFEAVKWRCVEVEGDGTIGCWVDALVALREKKGCHCAYRLTAWPEPPF